MRPFARSLAVAATLCATLLAPPATAQTITAERTLYVAGLWEVTLARFDDGAQSCIASVSNRKGVFSIWGNDDNSVFIGVNSPGLGEMAKTTALHLVVDRRAGWDLLEVDAEGDDIFVEIAGDNAGTRLIREIAAGNTVYLNNDIGGTEETFSLAGSAASIAALDGCMDAIVR